MNEEDKLVVHITKEKKIFIETCENGIIAFKPVSADGIMECLKQSINNKLTIHSGILPNNCISYTENDRGYRYAVISFEERMADIMFEKTVYKDFPLPRLVFGFNIDNSGRITGTRLGVTEVGRLTPKSKMFTYPFSNVSGFSLCTGSNSLPKITSLHQLNGLPYFILKMPNNYDHYSEERTKLKMDYRSLLEHLKDKDSRYYYDNVLIEISKTLNDFITEG